MAQLPLDPVAVNRSTNGFAHDETDGRRSAGSWNAVSEQHMGDEGRLCALGATTDRVPEVLPGAHALSAREHDSGRQLGAALAAAIGEDRAAGTGAHAKAEAVLLGATTVVRLESTLAHVGILTGVGPFNGHRSPTTRISFMGTRQPSLSTTRPRYAVRSQTVKLMPIRHLSHKVHATRRQGSTSWGKPLVCARQGC